jgi:hypothetical protein
VELDDEPAHGGNPGLTEKDTHGPMTHMLTLPALLRLAWATVTNPREGAATVLSMAPPIRALWLMFALVVTLTLFTGELALLLSGPPETGPLTDAYSSPLLLGVVQGAMLCIMVFAIHHIGRWFGGTGRFEEALLLVVWLQFVFVCAQVIQIALMLLMPPLAALMPVLVIGLFFWLLINFIAALHGFTSLGMVFVMTIVSGVGVLFALSLVLTLLGLAPDMTGPVAP